MPNISTIDPKKVQTAGNDLLEQAKRMENALNKIKDYVNNTKSFFQSEGGDKTRANFNSSAAKFTEFKKFTDEYGKFLQEYGGEMEGLTAQIADLGSKIPKL